MMGAGFDDKGKSGFFTHQPRTYPKSYAPLGLSDAFGDMFAPNDNFIFIVMNSFLKAA